MTLLLGTAPALDWGPYAAAVARWAAVLGRPAPPPTELHHKGRFHQLHAPFVEWMMGLPEGWVTAVPGVSRQEQLRALGNGVCPQQAALALRWLARGEEPAAADPPWLLPTPVADPRPTLPDGTPTLAGVVTGIPQGGGQRLLPTPVVNDMGAGKTEEWWEAWSAKHGQEDHLAGRSLDIDARRVHGTLGAVGE